MTAEEKLLDNGYEDVVIFRDFSYDDALIGVTHDNRAVYDFSKMVEWLQENEGMDETEAIEWIEYNTIRSLPYAGDEAPVVMYPLIDWEELMIEEYNIADSGNRTEFPSGAVRDMHETNGELKGRFDLLPMCVLTRLARHYEAGSKKYGDRNWEKGIPCHSFADSALRHLVKYLDGWTDEDHLIAAVWNLCGLAWTEEKKPELMDIPARRKDDG